ncbi:MAG TPA: DoxX family protein [Candidatus Paceibacterota bacterium]
MITAFLIGRFILGLYWLHAAYGHIFKSAGLTGYAQSKGVPSPRAAVIGTGILALLGSLSIILGVYTVWGIALLIIFLLGVSFKIHAFWMEQDPMAKMNDRISFWKNIALAAALLMILTIPASMWGWTAW